jgi:hypothetical protein
MYSKHVTNAYGVPYAFAVILKLLSLVGDLVDHCQQLVNINTVDGTGLFNGLTAGRGATQAMHADGEEHGSSLGSDVQDIADNGVFGDFDHGFYLRNLISNIVYPKLREVSTEKCRKEDTPECVLFVYKIVIKVCGLISRPDAS